VKHFLEGVYGAAPGWFQTLALNAYGWKIRRERFNADYDRWQREFLENERRPPAELRDLQDEALRDLVAHAHAKVPYYREVMSARGLTPGDIRGLADLPKLPILTKDILRARFADLVAGDTAPGRLRKGNSSGTTGSPVTVLWDRRVEVANNAAHWRARRWAGFHFGMAYASLLGRTIIDLKRGRPPFWRWNAPWHQLLLSSFHLKPENLPRYLEAMVARDVQFLDAYPSTGYVLARFLVESGRTFPLRGVVLSSETLLPFQREIIERAFVCPVFDIYSLAERVTFAGECHRHEGLHAQPEYGALEIVDERGEGVAPGRQGRVVATGLQNYGMPLIRYEVGDVSAIMPEPCPCGMGLSRMAPVTTKAEDIVVTPEGRFISSSTLTHPFKPMVNVEKSQIVQERPDHVTVRIVRRPGYTDADTETLVTALGERLGPSVKVDVEFVDDIPRGPGGKYRWVISKVPLRFGASERANLYE
jgi:phenylacetate-CoA ligase